MSKNEDGKSNQSGDLSKWIVPILVALITVYGTLIAAGKVPNPFERRASQMAPISGTWDGNIAAADGSFQTEVVFSFPPDCQLGQACGTYDTPQLGCKGDLIFKGITQDIYEFTENKSSEAAAFCNTNGIDRFMLDPDGQLDVTYLYTDARGTMSSSGRLTRR